MPIYLDGQPAEISGETLGAIMDAAQQRLTPAGRLLVEVKLDGRAILGEELDQQRAVPVEGVRVELESADPRQLAQTTLQQVRQGLQAARQDQIDAAGFFQQDQPAEAMQRVSRAIEAWQQAQQAVLHTTMLIGIKLDQKVFEDRPIVEVTDSLLTQLRSLRDLITAGDTVGLADSLAYEWPEMTDRWDRLIGQLIGWVAAGE